MSVNRRPSRSRRTAHAWCTRPMAGCYLRSMSDFEARPIPGTDAAINPVFSPDGQSLAFWSDSALKRIAVSGGAAVTDLPDRFRRRRASTGATTASCSRSRATRHHAGLAEWRYSRRCSSTLAESADGRYGPQLLPDGRTLLFTIAKRTTAATSTGGTTRRSSCSRLRRACARHSSRVEAMGGTSRPATLCTRRAERCSRCRSISRSSR